MATYCPTCGTSNPDDSKKCHICDTALTRFASDGALASGTLIHYRYRITKLIKAGGMGAVYLAKDIKKNIVKAVKELFKQFSPQEEQYVVQRFKEEALNDRDPDMRKDAVLVMTEKYKARALPSIITKLGDPDETVRDATIRAVVEINDPVVVDNLIECLRDPSPLVQQRAAWALGEFKDKKSLSGLLGLLGSRDGAVRATAAYALGNLEDERAVEYLCNTMLNDVDHDVRKYSAESLGQIGDKRASNSLLLALKKEQDIETRKIISKVFSSLKFKK